MSSEHSALPAEVGPAVPVSAATRREALLTMGLWLAACVYTVGYAGLFAYLPKGATRDPRLILGIPEWIVWGIFLPWTVCTLASCWMAFRGIRDEDLGEERETGEGVA